MFRNVVTALILSASLSFYSLSHAQDTRSLAMGGAAVTAGTGAAGALSNPALMINAEQRGDNHININLYSALRDSGDLISEIEDNEDLIEDIEAEIDVVSAQSIACTSGDPAEVCITNTENLSELSEEVLRLLNKADGNSFDVRGGLDFGYVRSAGVMPILINIGFRGTAVGSPDITQNDKDYVTDLTNVLNDNQLTLGELQSSPSLSINTTTGTVDVVDPDDVLDSTVSATVATRGQLSIGFAHSFALKAFDLDLGVTPKISTLTVGDIDQSVNDVDGDIDADDQLEASENSGTTFTFDVGAIIPISDSLTIGALAKNIVPESIRTKNNVLVETTPQLIISTLFATDQFQLSADLALNEAKEDNFETQLLNAGAETTFGFFSLRAGFQHDLSVDDNPTDFTFGVGLGPVSLSAGYNQRITRAGLQINASF